MIEVKPFKQQKTHVPSAEEIYRKPDDAPSSRGPAVVVVALTAIAIYLKSLFPSLAQPDPGTLAETQEVEPSGAEHPQETAVEPEDETDPPPPDDETVLGSGGPGPEVGGIADFMGIDSPALDYHALPPTRPPSGPGGENFGLTRPSNDNRTNVAFDDTAVGLAGVGAVSSRGFEALSPASGAPGIKPPAPIDLTPDPRENEEGDDDKNDGDGGPTNPDPVRNRAPVLSGPVTLANTGICQTVLITAAALLSGAFDADGNTLSIVNLNATSGTLTKIEAGWEFKPAAGYYGPVSFSYAISDGEVAVAQTASLSVVEFMEIIGTPGDDNLVGTECADLIDGSGGNDTIDARGGSDIVYGSAGADIIHAGAGHDLIYAGHGDDTVYGGTGNDTIHGGAGNDELHGEEGDDVIFGEAGDDVITGGAGGDQLVGGAGNDQIHGDAGDDTIDGGDGDDVAEGGDGDDMIDGGAGADKLSGGIGNDHIIGAGGNDAISGEDGDDILDGGDGDDEIDGGAGQNIIVTGNGSNRVSAGDGGNTVMGGNGQDLVQLGAGRDTVRLGGGADLVAAGAGDDVIFGEDGDDTLFAEEGDDVASGGRGKDHLVGGAGSDVLDGDEGDDIIDGGEGNDRIAGGEGADVILANDGCDEVEGGAGNDVILGGAGDDTLAGGAGDDLIEGGDDDDTIAGGEGDDTLDGGDGVDIVLGGDGADRIAVALDGEDDCYDGGAGFDTLDLSGTTLGVTVDVTNGFAIGIEIGEDTVVDLDAIIGGSGDDQFIVGAKAMLLTGGAGEDIFNFEVNCGDEQRELIHEILDLEAGDRIIVQEYHIRTGTDDCDEAAEGERFDSAYGNGPEGSERPFRFRIEKIDDEDYTYVDVYITQTDEKDFTIEILGNHKFHYG